MRQRTCNVTSSKCTLLFLLPKHSLSHFLHTLLFSLNVKEEEIQQRYKLSICSSTHSFKTIWWSARCSVTHFGNADHTGTSHLCCITAWAITVSRRQAAECHRCAPPHRRQAQGQAAEGTDRGLAQARATHRALKTSNKHTASKQKYLKLQNATVGGIYHGTEAPRSGLSSPPPVRGSGHQVKEWVCQSVRGNVTHGSPSHARARHLVIPPAPALMCVCACR